MLTSRQTAKNVLPLLAPPTPTQPSMLESEKQAPFLTPQAPPLETVKTAPYPESDYRWLASVLELLIDIGNRDEALSFNIISRRDYRQLSPLLEELVDAVGENVQHPATSLMMLVGFLVERYEKENVPKLSDLPTEPVEEADGTEEASVEWNDEWEILEIRDLTPEEMQELEKKHPPAAILEWTETEVTIHAFFSIGNILSEGGWIREAIFAYDMVLRLKPDFAEAYYNRGTAKTFIAEYEAAIADFDTAIRRKPDFAAAYYNRGAAKLAFNQIKAATSDFRTTLKLAEQQDCKNIKTNVTQRLKELRDTE
ncbi:hypothetical protein F4009_22865 [Candidatus Poribacteria bacterium]|nr:hypothetical protein [Candidatus Poribacteria bacterium]MYA69893.1 hypothetical protein [Candidatus Poribacteria bacterium]MYH80235.1 hypothetical protein [Candidatus Poribacteria bacterium]MYK96800.1 hypothetical protein [Candidatus Poribacteria bacterium]